MIKLKYTLFLLFLGSTSLAQVESGREAIKEFCGCFQVEFKYMETFATDKDYQAYPPYKTGALELIMIDEEYPEKLVLQHILVIDDSFFIKHWRQDWEYEPVQLFTFRGNKTWESFKTNSDGVQNQWSQKIYEVDDSPRYSGSATWFIADNKKIWLNTSNAPLPRREYTKRKDYDILRRTNTLIIEDWGWIHEQDNQKIALKETGERLIVEEKGRNTYRRVDPSQCSNAEAWWKTERSKWKAVREDWNEWMKDPVKFQVVKETQDTYMNQSLEKAFAQEYKSDLEHKQAIREVLNTFRKEISTENP